MMMKTVSFLLALVALTTNVAVAREECEGMFMQCFKQYTTITIHNGSDQIGSDSNDNNNERIVFRHVVIMIHTCHHRSFCSQPVSRSLKMSAPP